jgi:hypothetical protein
MKTPSLLSLLLTAVLSTSSSHANSPIIPSHIASSAEGAWVENKETGERLFFACAKKDDQGRCVSYRFFSWVGTSSLEVIGESDFKVLDISHLKIAEGESFFSDRPALPTLSWMAEGFKNLYREDGWLESANVYFASPIPLVGLPGIGAAVLVGCTIYDTSRLLILFPIEVGKSIVTSLQARKVQRAFAAMFDGRKHNKVHRLRAPRFRELKEILLKMASAQIPPSPQGAQR